MASYRGNLLKMESDRDEGGRVSYRIPVGDRRIGLTPSVGTHLALRYLGSIHCVACGRSTRKSFNQGFCFPCSQRLARCDLCIVRPERCHYSAGTCREPQWGEQHCLIPHIVYLANTSALKVGVTRHSQIPTRWIDQGATQALPLFQVASRYHAGLLEVVLKGWVSDRTDWRAMLRGSAEPLDMVHEALRLLGEAAEALQALQPTLDESELTPCVDTTQSVTFDYPVIHYPEKIRSHNFDKEPLLEGQLVGIKGQYLIFDSGVVNIRKYGGYEVELTL